MPSTIKVRTFSVTFSEPIPVQELESFRGAVAEKVGLDREWYHNHDNDPSQAASFHYRYPLIQYQLNRGQPKLLFLNEAIDEARHFFTQPDWQLKMAGRTYSSQIDQLKADQLVFGLGSEMRPYTLRRWLALNERNHYEFQATKRLSKKIELLERILVGHILNMATGFNYRFPEHFTLYLSDISRRRRVSYKGVEFLAFDLSFWTNAVLPVGLSVGKRSSLGNGRIGKYNDIEKYIKS